MRSSSPLRYPGGKSLMTPFFVELFELNMMNCPAYAEPYAGGAGAAESGKPRFQEHYRRTHD